MTVFRSFPTGMSLVGAVLAFGLAPSAAVAGDEQAATPAPAEQAVADKHDPNRVVCRRLQAIGSITRVKVCKTAAEWAKEAGKTDSRTVDGLHPSGGGVQIHG